MQKLMCVGRQDVHRLIRLKPVGIPKFIPAGNKKYETTSPQSLWPLGLGLGVGLG
jgi:hypothetical protein